MKYASSMQKQSQCIVFQCLQSNENVPILGMYCNVKSI